jgi:hypothetical protein
VLFPHQNVSDFFNDLLTDIKCRPDTRAYIVSIFSKYKTADHDLSQYSIGERFCQARQTSNFASYQNLADYLFFCNSVAPQFLNNASKDYYDTIARLSYYSCYRLINRQWLCFEELADQLLMLEDQVQQRVPKLQNLNFPRS